MNKTIFALVCLCFYAALGFSAVLTGVGIYLIHSHDGSDLVFEQVDAWMFSIFVDWFFYDVRFSVLRKLYTDSTLCRRLTEHHLRPPV